MQTHTGIFRWACFAAAFATIIAVSTVCFAQPEDALSVGVAGGFTPRIGGGGGAAHHLSTGYVEYESSVFEKLSIAIRFAATEYDSGYDNEGGGYTKEIDGKGAGIQGGIYFYPFYRWANFYVGANLGASLLHYEKKPDGYTGQWIQRSSSAVNYGLTVGLKVYLPSTDIYLSPSIQAGTFNVRKGGGGFDYVGAGLAAGMSW
jgi:hypothetical protein